MRPAPLAAAFASLALATTALADHHAHEGHGSGKAAAPASAEPKSAAPAEGAQEVRVTVEKGYHLDVASVTEGKPIRLVFVRKEYSGCTKEVVVPSLGIRRELPVGKEVVIDVPAQQPGDLAFECGMKMVKGKLKVTPKA